MVDEIDDGVVLFDDPPSARHVAALAEMTVDGDYPSAVRERCFDLWLSRCGHSYVRLAQEVGIKETTLRGWGRRGHWAQRAYDLALDVEVGDIRPLTMINLQVAALECSRYFVEVASGRSDASRAKSEACRTVLDRAGYGPGHFLPMEQRVAPAAPLELPDLTGLTADELAALEQRLIDGSG